MFKRLTGLDWKIKATLLQEILLQIGYFTDWIMVKVKRLQFLNYSMSKNTNILEERDTEKDVSYKKLKIEKILYSNDLVLTTQLFPKRNFSNYLMEENMKLMMVMMIRYMISITKKT